MLDEQLLLELARQPFRWSRARYERLVDAGVLGPDDKVELLDGILVPMDPQKASHASTIRRLRRLLGGALAGRAEVDSQLPLALDDTSEPEPDLAVVQPGNYEAEHPRRASLVIEVADGSVRKDRLVKGPLYAAAGIAEYWIVNLPEACVEVYREPAAGGYGACRRAVRGETIGLLAFPDVALRVDEILPAAR